MKTTQAYIALLLSLFTAVFWVCGLLKLLGTRVGKTTADEVGGDRVVLGSSQEIGQRQMQAAGSGETVQLVSPGNIYLPSRTFRFRLP